MRAAWHAVHLALPSGLKHMAPPRPPPPPLQLPFCRYR